MSIADYIRGEGPELTDEDGFDEEQGEEDLDGEEGEDENEEGVNGEKRAREN